MGRMMTSTLYWIEPGHGHHRAAADWISGSWTCSSLAVVLIFSWYFSFLPKSKTYTLG